MKKGDLITVALIMVNLIGIGLLMANTQFVPASPGTSYITIPPILVSPTPHPSAAIGPTVVPSPTIVLAINRDVTVLNEPIGIGITPGSYQAQDPTPTPTPTATPVPTIAHKSKARTTIVPTTRAVPTVRPSATPHINNKAEKNHWQDQNDD